MLKKCLIVIMSSLIAFIPVTVCTAASVTEIVADVNIYTVTIRATADAKGDYPLKVYRMVNGEPESEPVYMGQTESAPAIWEKVVGEGENKRVITLYTYTFDPFELDVMSKSGKYLAVVGDSASQEFSFINKQDKIVFYNQISAAAESELNTLLQSGADDGLVDFDLGNYFSYSTKIQTAFNTALASFELPVLSDDASDEEIRFFETLLKEEFARLLAAGDFLSADSTGFDSAVKQATELNLDLKFYDHEKLKLSPAAVHSRMQDVLPYNLENYQVQNTFNFAVLMAMLDTASYGFVTEALDYYNGKCVNLSDKHTKEFDNVDFNTLSSELKKVASNIKNASQLEAKYDEIAEKIEEILRKENLKLEDKILILGHGENIYIPSRIASYLPYDTYFKTTTRSPICCDGEIIKDRNYFYDKGVKYYFYNKEEVEKKYKKIIMIAEGDCEIKLCENMILVKV